MNPTLCDYEKAKNIYRSTFREVPTSITPYLSGLGNVLFLINNQIVVRLKKTYDQKIDHLENEKRAFLLASEARLSPQLILFYENGDAIYRKDDGEPFLSSSMDANLLTEIGRFLKSFHSLPKNEVSPFDAKKHFDFYKSEAKISLPLHPKEREIRSFVEKEIAQCDSVLSHNDIVHGNLLKNGSSLCLIDFEYAGTNSPYFDLASLLSENRMEKNEQKVALLKGYFGNATDLDIKKCDYFIAYEDLLWAYWALARWNKTKNDAFQSIYKEKREAITLHADSLFL